MSAGPAPAADWEFLRGSGEMHALVRAHDWSATPLGPPAGWPLALRTTLQLVLASNYPMLIWWGPQLLQFYNDAYRHTMDAARHPAALGQGARACWAEAWDLIGPEINHVLSGAGAILREDQRVPLLRDGQPCDTWWTYGFSAIEDEQGIGGVLVIGSEVTREHQSRDLLRTLNGELAREVEQRKQAEAALVAERDRIDAALDRSEGDLERQVQDWRRLHAMSNALLQAPDELSQYQTVLAAVTEFHGVRQGILSLYDPDAGALATRASIGLSPQKLERMALVPPGLGACTVAFAERRRVVIADTERDPAYAQFRPVARELGVRALYSTPFYSTGGETLGVLCVFFPEPCWPTERQMQLADMCAAQIALFVERARAEQRLRQEQARSEQRRRLYETILSNTPDLAYVWDLNHRFTYANETLLKVWGKTWDEAIGKNCLELGYEPWHAAMHDREIEFVVATRQTVQGEVPFSGTLGRRVYEYILVPVLGPDGQVEAVAGTTRDTTERQRNEDSLRQLAADLAEASRRKTEFLATLAHELRNPLAPLRSGLDLMRLAPSDPAAIARVRDMMGRQIDHMVHLVDDLLDVARISSGKVELKRERVALAAIVASAVEASAPLLQAKRHTLLAAPPHEGGDAGLWLDADPTRLVQVLSNLLANAAKYTPAGGRIELSVRREDGAVEEGGGRGMAVISVADNGIGIPADDLPKVFDMFSQVGRNMAHAQGGLGIGLSLVQQLVEMHGGGISAASAGPGQGSTFTICLPLAQAPVQGEAPGPAGPVLAATGAGRMPAGLPESAATRSLTVLVADDNRDAAEALGALLSAAGHAVLLAHDGQAAVATVRDAGPDIALVDLGMPVLNGYEVARAVRALPHAARTVLIALTGWGDEDARERSRDAGFDHHLTKPIGAAVLYRLLASAPSP